jgi:lipopolysaccharide transport system permease protein
MYVTPVVFPASLVPERWRFLLALNPMASAVEGVRWATLGRNGLTASMVLVSSVVTLAMLLGGLLFFRRVERRFSDVI